MTAIDVLRGAREQLRKGWSGPHAEARPFFEGNSERADREPCGWSDEGVFRLDLTGALRIASHGDDAAFMSAWRSFERVVAPVWALEADFLAQLGPGGLPPFSEETKPLFLRARQIFALEKGPDADAWLQHPHRMSVEVLRALDRAILRAQMGERNDG